MKYWGRCLLVYLTITAVLYGTNSVAPEALSDPTPGPGVAGGSDIAGLKAEHGNIY